MEQKEADRGEGGGEGWRGHLPEDVLCRILCLLPLPTLFQLRCVCRLWRSLPFSLLFSPSPSPSSRLHHHYWLFVFRLLARKVNERTNTWSVEFDKELLGASSLHASQPWGPSAAEVLAQSPLLQRLATGSLDLVAAMNNGLLVFSLRVHHSQAEESQEKLKLFVYHPATKALRVLPSPRWRPQMIAAAMAEGGRSSYQIYSLGKHVLLGIDLFFFSFEVFDSSEGSWKFLSHVHDNLNGDAQLCRNEAIVLGYSNSHAVCTPDRLLYWMPTLLDGHREESGLYTLLSACDMDTGYLYRTPSLPFRTSFASMWPTPTGVQLMCGVALPQDEPPSQVATSHEDDYPKFPLFSYPYLPHQPTHQQPTSPLPEEFPEGSLGLTVAVEVWEWHQAEDQEHAKDDVYGCRELPRGAHWELVSKMPQDLWAKLTCEEKGRGHKVSCVIAHSIDTTRILLLAKGQEEHMVIYEPSRISWKLSPCYEYKTLSKLFLDEEPSYFKALPWSIAFNPFITDVNV